MIRQRKGACITTGESGGEEGEGGRRREDGVPGEGRGRERLRQLRKWSKEHGMKQERTHSLFKDLRGGDNDREQTLS